jgi:hypothetical protein
MPSRRSDVGDQRSDGDLSSDIRHPTSGLRTELILDRGERKIVAVASQDVEPILAHNAALRGEAQRSEWGRHIATVPNVILVQWLNEEHARGNTGLRMFSPEFYALVARKLADPEWKHLRTDR